MRGQVIVNGLWFAYEATGRVVTVRRADTDEKPAVLTGPIDEDFDVSMAEALVAQYAIGREDVAHRAVPHQ